MKAGFNLLDFERLFCYRTVLFVLKSKVHTAPPLKKRNCASSTISLGCQHLFIPISATDCPVYMIEVMGSWRVWLINRGCVPLLGSWFHLWCIQWSVFLPLLISNYPCHLGVDRFSLYWIVDAIHFEKVNITNSNIITYVKKTKLRVGKHGPLNIPEVGSCTYNV